MTKAEIEFIIKRYKYFKKAIKAKRKEASFYIGKRKYKIFITQETKMIYEIIEDIKRSQKDDWIGKMVKGILAGKSDTFLIGTLPCERTMYYKWKQKFIQTVYRCCIAKQMVGYEELLKEGIA